MHSFQRLSTLAKKIAVSLQSRHYKIYLFLKKTYANFVLDDWSRGRIDIKTLPSKIRKFVFLCLIFLGFILICTITLYSFDKYLPEIAFSLDNTTFTISYITLAVTLVSFIFGWAIIILGGIWSNIVMYAVICIFFIYFFGLIILDPAHRWWIVLPLSITAVFIPLSLKRSKFTSKTSKFISLLILCFCISFLFVFVTPVKHLLPDKFILPLVFSLTIIIALGSYAIGTLKKWRFPEESFTSIGRLIAFLIITIFISVFLRRTFQINLFTENLFTIFNRILAYVSLFWFILGFSALWGIISISEWVRDTLEIAFPKRIIFAIVFLFWSLIILLNIYPIALPYPLSCILTWTNIAVIFFIILIFRNFTVSRILTLLQFTVLIGLILQAYYTSAGEMTKELDSRWMSFAMFLIGITWLLFQGSGVIINSTGKLFPRNSRLFIFFGLIFVMLGMNNIMLVARYEEFMRQVKISAFNGFLYMGPPFLMYKWFVKNLKRNPVRPPELALLFMWGAIIAHIIIAAERTLGFYGAPLYITILAVTIILQYLLFLIMKKLIYNSSFFNESIDGIIYSASITLGSSIFYLHPQFSLLLYPLRAPASWNMTYLPNITSNASFIWYYFTAQFVCSSLVGYGLSKAKLSGIPYNKLNLFATWPLNIVWILAVLYKTISDTLFKANLNILLIYGTIWPCAVFSLLIIGAVISAAMNTFRKFLKFSYIIGILIVLSSFWLLHQKKTIIYKTTHPYFELVVPRSWQKLPNAMPDTILTLEGDEKSGLIHTLVSTVKLPEGTTLEDYSRITEEILRSKGIETYGPKGLFYNLNGVRMINYPLPVVTTMAKENNIILYCGLIYIFLEGRNGYSILFLNPKQQAIDPFTIDPVINSFRFKNSSIFD